MNGRVGMAWRKKWGAGLEVVKSPSKTLGNINDPSFTFVSLPLLSAMTFNCSLFQYPVDCDHL